MKNYLYVIYRVRYFFGFYMGCQEDDFMFFNSGIWLVKEFMCYLKMIYQYDNFD